jgi:hypothetical protein
VNADVTATVGVEDIGIGFYIKEIAIGKADSEGISTLFTVYVGV